LKIFVTSIISIMLLLSGVLALSYSVREDSAIAQKIDRSNFREERISHIIPGDWDIVCPIDGYARPSHVIDEAGYPDLTFSPSGNSERQILSDDESGVIVINRKARKYSIFLFSYYDKTSLIPEIGKGQFAPCFSFEKTMLAKTSLANDGWQHLALRESK
jgi:hypothetical protein